MFIFHFNTFANELETNIKKLNFTCDTLHESLLFIFLIMGVNMNSSWLPCAQYEFELGLLAICTMWTSTWVSCHMHKTLITQMLIWSSYFFQNDKQMFFNLLFNSLISKEGRNAISYTQIALLLKSNYLFG
jgi:hypothetical protein